MDYIGKVKLNYEYYAGIDEYSDGEEVENTLLEIVKSNSDYKEIINKTNSWPVLYHLSEVRGNIVEWLPITKDDNVLEIGAGCGAIEKPCIVNINTIKFKYSENKTDIKTNGFSFDDTWFYFYGPDPIINISLNHNFKEEELFVDFYATQDNNDLLLSLSDKYMEAFKELDVLSHELNTS